MAKSKRKTPAQIAEDLAARKRQSFEAVNLPPEVAELLAGANIEITRAGETRDKQTVQENSARRVDAFAALKDGMDKGAYDAARRLERDMLIRRGEGDRGRIMERVDGQEPKDQADLMLRAGNDCDFIRGRLSRRDWWLFVDLIAPTIERGDWRAHVFYITGENNRDAQGACVRSACVNLRDAYEDLDQAGQRRAA